MDPSKLLEVGNLTKTFSGMKALDNVSLTVSPRTIVGLIGPNGSGKTTAFNCISGFYPYDTGDVSFNGEKISGLAPHLIAQKGLIRTFQISKAPKKMTVLENMLLGAQNPQDESIFASLFKRSKIEATEKKTLARAWELLETVKISHLANEYAGNLSGGQQKLLSLARILIRDPDLIMLDEPAAGVNPTLVKSFIQLVKDLRDKHGKTFLIIEHNMNFIKGVCDEVFVLDAGSNLAQGSPDVIQRDPRVLEVYLGRRQNEKS